LPHDLTEKWQAAASNSILINLYGPTETTIAISYYQWNKSTENKSMNGIVSIGKVFKDHEAGIFADDHHEALDGTRGFLHICGPQVVPGYLDDPDSTKKSFVEFQHSGDSIWYNTGDLVQQDEDGDLFFLGREDAEVKISGYRVNLLEIDHCIREFTSFEWVATVQGRNEFPVCFIQADLISDDKSVIQACKNHLPWYMLPEKIIFVEAMPLNPNGKIDRNKLKQML